MKKTNEITGMIAEEYVHLTKGKDVPSMNKMYALVYLVSRDVLNVLNLPPENMTFYFKDRCRIRTNPELPPIRDIFNQHCESEDYILKNIVRHVLPNYAELADWKLDEIIAGICFSMYGKDALLNTSFPAVITLKELAADAANHPAYDYYTEEYFNEK